MGVIRKCRLNYMEFGNNNINKNEKVIKFNPFKGQETKRTRRQTMKQKISEGLCVSSRSKRNYNKRHQSDVIAVLGLI